MIVFQKSKHRSGFPHRRPFRFSDVAASSEIRLPKQNGALPKYPDVTPDPDQLFLICVCITDNSYLIEEHVFPVRALGGKLLDDALGADAVLSAQLLPELETNCNTATHHGFMNSLFTAPFCPEHFHFQHSGVFPPSHTPACYHINNGYTFILKPRRDSESSDLRQGRLIFNMKPKKKKNQKPGKPFVFFPVFLFYFFTFFSCLNYLMKDHK